MSDPRDYWAGVGGAPRRHRRMCSECEKAEEVDDDAVTGWYQRHSWECPAGPVPDRVRQLRSLVPVMRELGVSRLMYLDTTIELFPSTRIGRLLRALRGPR